MEMRDVHLTFPLRSVFLALPLEGSAKQRFQELQDVLQPYAEMLRFQNPQTPHLTLQFWKEVMEIEWKPIVKKMEEIAARTKPFILNVTGVDTFCSRGIDHVLFLTIAFSPELASLKKLCPWPSASPFAPHITLARIAHPQRFAVVKKKVMKTLEDVAFDISIDRLRLYAEINGRKQTMVGEYVL